MDRQDDQDEEMISPQYNILSIHVKTQTIEKKIINQTPFPLVLPKNFSSLLNISLRSRDHRLLWPAFGIR